MKPKIVFLDEYSVDNTDLTAIRELGDYTGYEYARDEDVVKCAADADIIITNKTRVTAEAIANLPDLKLICVAATGMNNIDLDAAKAAGIEVRNAVDYSSHSVAEQTFAGVLALYKQLIFLDEYVKSDGYSSAERLFNFERPTYELHGKKWGIVGLGNIGRMVAGLATAFGCEVSYYSTSGNNSNPEYSRMETLEELMRWSDIVSIHAPLSRDTHHLIDYHQLSLMKPTSIIVNVARGSLVNEEGLARAINDGLIAGAALDVYGAEPMAADNPLKQVKDQYRLLMTPHLAWATREALVRLVDKIAENIRNFLSEQG